MNIKKSDRVIKSGAILVLSLGLAYAPLPLLVQNITVVSGTELAEPLTKIEANFETKYPNIKIELKTQGSQDLVNNYIDKKNDFSPTVLIPASAGFLDELAERWLSQNHSAPFYQTPRPIAKTFLVGIAWPKRGKILFPDGRFSWEKIEQAMLAENWQKIGGESDWGSFDFLTTDPSRSNSGQITLSLWAQSKLGGGNNLNNLNSPAVESLFRTIKKSLYQPPRSTDVLLQEFITRGPNDADVATVYESIGLYRWKQSGTNQSNPYKIYYLNPTIETVATAAIVSRDVGKGEAKAASQFIEFLTQPEQQKIFVEYGFRPVDSSIDLKSVPNSPWNQNIPGAQINPQVSVVPVPKNSQLEEIQKLWQRAN
jgi:ABC-type molybdate transport system substrate-binding protein